MWLVLRVRMECVEDGLEYIDAYKLYHVYSHAHIRAAIECAAAATRKPPLARVNLSCVPVSLQLCA